MCHLQIHRVCLFICVLQSQKKDIWLLNIKPAYRFAPTTLVYGYSISSDFIFFQCADTVGIDFSKVEECIETEGDDILADLGDQTHSVEPTITFVPTVIYNDVYNQELQDLSLVDFKGVVCGLTADLDLDVCKEANTTDSPAQVTVFSK